MLTIIIIGGGLAGLSAAIALARSGHRVTLLEARDEFTELGAGMQMPPNSTQAMQSLGILNEVRSKATSPHSVAFRSFRDGQILHRSNLCPDMEDRFGTPHLLIHRKEILQILVQRARRFQDISLRLSSPVIKIDLPSQCVLTAKGDIFKGDVIIGADGDRSFCRSKILGRPDPPEPTGRLVYRLTIELNDLREDSDLRFLVDPPGINCWMGPRAHAVSYELTYNGILNFILVCPDPVEGRIQLGPQDANKKELKCFLTGWDPVLSKLVDISKNAKYWTILQLAGESRRWIDNELGRMLLIGDAAHAMAPFLAQGASQSMEDGVFLGHLLPEGVPETEITARLEFFCRRRQERTLSTRATSLEVGHLLELTDGVEQHARDLQMLQNQICEGFPNPFADPVLQKWLYEYNVEADVRAFTMGS